MNDGEQRPMSTALVRHVPETPSIWDEVRLQRLWLSLQQRSWRSLAVLPAGKGMDTLPTAEMLAKIAWWYTGQPACVLDMRDLSLRLLEHQIREMGAQLQGGERVFVALRAIAENPTAIPLAMAADSAVLCVELGATRMREAQETLTAVGRDRFIGSVLVSPMPPTTVPVKVGGDGAAEPGGGGNGSPP